MIGILKLTNRGIVARCGYKYLRFEPGIQILPARRVLMYKGEQYDYDEDCQKLHVEFFDTDIVKETMSALVIQDCTILNRQQKSGECKTNSGFRSLVFQKGGRLAPIIRRISNGTRSGRCDIFTYSDRDYVKFHVDWISDRITQRQESSYEGFKCDDGIPYLTQFDSHTDDMKTLWQDFLKVNSRGQSLLNEFPVMSQKDQNKYHFERFKRRYEPWFKNHFPSVDISKHDTMDVLDLLNIDELKLSNPEAMATYMAFQVYPFKFLTVSKGLDIESCEGIKNDPTKFYYLLIPNVSSHRIKYSGGVTVVDIANRNGIRYTSKELIFLKFNYPAVKKYMTNMIISELDNER